MLLSKKIVVDIGVNVDWYFHMCRSQFAGSRCTSQIFSATTTHRTRFVYKEPLYKEPACRMPKYLKNLYY